MCLLTCIFQILLFTLTSNLLLLELLYSDVQLKHSNEELLITVINHVDFKETLGRLMLQDPVFPAGHHLAGYHYSGKYWHHRKINLPPVFFFSDFLPLFKCFPILSWKRTINSVLRLIYSQAPTAGLQKRSATSIRGSRPTGRISLWCRNWYAR